MVYRDDLSQVVRTWHSLGWVCLSKTFIAGRVRKPIHPEAK